MHRMQARILLSSDKRPASYMRMFYVSSQATKQVAARLRQGEADNVAGFVIDLRNNPGMDRLNGRTSFSCKTWWTGKFYP